MIIYLRKPISLSRINIQHLLNQILKLCADKLRKLILSRQYLFVQFCSIGIFKWQVSTDHRKQNDSARPDIHFQAIVLLAWNHFRWSVARRPTGCLQKLTWFVSIAEPKINDFQGILPVNQQILRFEVAMNNIQFMNISDATYNLLEKSTCLCLGQFVLLNYIVK